MHSTLEEIATWVKTVELPTPQISQLETETFYEDDTTEESGPSRQSWQSYKGREAQAAYLSPPKTPPPVAFLMQVA